MTVHIRRLNALRTSYNTVANIKRIVLQSPQHQQIQASPKPVRTPENPKHWLLVVAHSDGGLLDDHAHQTIVAAAILADALFEKNTTSVAVLIMGGLHQDLAKLGADEVIVLPELDFQKYQPDTELAVLQQAINQYQPQHILMPDNAMGDGDLGRRLAAKTQKTIATHVVELSITHVASYQQNGFQIVATRLTEIILLAPNTTETSVPFIGKATTKSLQGEHLFILEHAKNTYKDLGLDAIEAGQTPLEEADCVVSAGNGVSDVSTIATLAHLLDASIGASRVAVDDGKFKREQQVGATGKTVIASTYFAIGISGAVQHLQGIKNCRHVIAINKDASAPIVKRADLSIIGDAEDIMQSLIQAIKLAREPVKEAEA